MSVSVCVHTHGKAQLTLLISSSVVFAANKKISIHDLSYVGNVDSFMQVKFILISLHPSFSQLFWFVFLPRGKHSSSISFSSVTSAASHPHLLLLPPSLPFSLCVCRWNGQPASFSYFLAAKWLAKFRRDEERGVEGGLQKVTFALCSCGKKKQQGREKEGGSKERKWKAGLDQLRLHCSGVMENALWGNIQYARVSSSMQSLQWWCMSLSVFLFV